MKRIILLLVGLLLCGCAKETCETIKESHTMYLQGASLIKIYFDEAHDICTKNEEEYEKNKVSEVTKIELLSSGAKELFKGVELSNLNVEEFLKKYEEINKSKNIEIESIRVYTSSLRDYSGILTYKEEYKVLSDDKALEYIMKKMPLKTFKIKIDVTDGSYYENYEFLSDDLVHIYTTGQCFGACDESENYNYTYEYDVEKDIINIVIKNNGKQKLVYSFKDNLLSK